MKNLIKKFRDKIKQILANKWSRVFFCLTSLITVGGLGFILLVLLYYLGTGIISINDIIEFNVLGKLKEESFFTTYIPLLLIAILVTNLLFLYCTCRDLLLKCRLLRYLRLRYRLIFRCLLLRCRRFRDVVLKRRLRYLILGGLCGIVLVFFYFCVTGIISIDNIIKFNFLEQVKTVSFFNTHFPLLLISLPVALLLWLFRTHDIREQLKKTQKQIEKTQENINFNVFANAQKMVAAIERDNNNKKTEKTLINQALGLLKILDLQRQGLFLKEIGIIIRKIDFSGIDLKNQDLQGADLEKANLQYANLEDADLEGANLRGTNLEGANLEGAGLYGANLYQADLRRASLRQAVLSKATLLCTKLQEADLEVAELSETDFRYALLKKSQFNQGRAHKTRLFKEEETGKLLFIPEEMEGEELYNLSSLLCKEVLTPLLGKEVEDPIEDIRLKEHIVLNVN